MLRHPPRSTGNADAALRTRREAPLRAPHVTDREDRVRRLAGSSGTARARRATNPARAFLSDRIEHHLGRLRDTAAPLRAGSIDDDVARCDPPTQGFAVPSVPSTTGSSAGSSAESSAGSWTESSAESSAADSPTPSRPRVAGPADRPHTAELPVVPVLSGLSGGPVDQPTPG